MTKIDRLGFGGGEFFLDGFVAADGFSGLEIFEFEDLADLDIDVLLGTVDFGDAAGPGDGSFERIGFDDPVTANEFPSFGKRATGGGALSGGEFRRAPWELG